MTEQTELTADERAVLLSGADVRQEVKEALNGEVPDQEHDALVRVGEALGLVNRDGAFWTLAD